MAGAILPIIGLAIEEGPKVISLIKGLINLIKGKAKEAEVTLPATGSGALRFALVLKEALAFMEEIKKSQPELASQLPNLDELKKLISLIVMTLSGEGVINTPMSGTGIFPTPIPTIPTPGFSGRLSFLNGVLTRVEG